MVFSNSLFIDENDISLNTLLIDQDRKKKRMKLIEISY